MKTLARLLALFALSFACHAQEAYPGKPIRLVVPYPPGGVGDAVARMIAPGWSAALKQPIVIENRGGAGSNIGLDAVAKSAPDGYTIGLFDTALATNPSLYPAMPFDAQRDLAPISLIARGPLSRRSRSPTSSRWRKRIPAPSRTRPQATERRCTSPRRC
jgi:tripartite-type tricarboxylate transporter receptor subunit TctC